MFSPASQQRQPLAKGSPNPGYKVLNQPQPRLSAAYATPSGCQVLPCSPRLGNRPILPAKAGGLPSQGGQVVNSTSPTCTLSGSVAQPSMVATIPGTPASLEYRAVRAARTNESQATPKSEPHEVIPSSYQPSPMVQYRSVALTTVSHKQLPMISGAAAVIMGTPVPTRAPSRTIAPGSVDDLTAARRRPSEVMSHPVVSSPQRGEPERAVRVSAAVDDTAVQKTVAMLPPSPDNTLPEFFDMIVAGERKPAMCHSEPRRSVDVQRYWEKRRVQNSLRRLLESLQECFDVEGGKQTAMLGAVAHDELRRIWRGEGSSNIRGGLNEEAFTEGLELLGAWPPELSAADRREVFTALLASSAASVRALSLGQPLPLEVTKRMLCSGLQSIPFNLPDFPVPAHLVLQGCSVSEVADAIAHTFSMEYTGLDRVKDFFLCGLLSLEEIQAALPFVVASSLVEEAVSRVVAFGREYFTSREWLLLVEDVRIALQEPSGDEQHEMQPPPPPPTQTAQTVQDMLQETPRPVEAGHAPIESPVPRFRQLSPTMLPEEGVAFAVVTEAAEMPSANEHKAEPRLSHHEETTPVRLQEQANSGGHYVINWGTTQWAAGAEHDAASGLPPGHQADARDLVGAGTRNGQDGGDQPPQITQPAQPPPTVPQSPPFFPDDPLRWISMDLHNECLGPFLATAFVRCCQLYDAHRDEWHSQPRRAA